jgi:hypothetical protein
MAISDNGPQDGPSTILLARSPLPCQLYHVDDIFNPLNDAPPDPPPLSSSTKFITTMTTAHTPSYLTSSYQHTSAATSTVPIHGCHYVSNYSFAAQRSTSCQPLQADRPLGTDPYSQTHNYDFYDHHFHDEHHPNPTTVVGSAATLLGGRRGREDGDNCPLVEEEQAATTSSSSSSPTNTLRTFGILFTIVCCLFSWKWHQPLTH